MASSTSFEKYVYSGLVATLIGANRWLGALILNLIFRYPCLTRSQAIDIVQRIESLGSDRNAKRIIRSCFNKLGITSVCRTNCRPYRLNSAPVFDSATTPWDERIACNLGVRGGPFRRDKPLSRWPPEEPLYSLAITHPASTVIGELRRSLFAENAGPNIAKTMLIRHWVSMAELHLQLMHSDEHAAAGFIAVGDRLAAYRDGKHLDYVPLINSPSMLVDEFEKLKAESTNVVPERSVAVARIPEGCMGPHNYSTLEETISQTSGWSRVRFW